MKEKHDRAWRFRISIWLAYLAANLLLILLAQKDGYRKIYIGCILAGMFIVTFAALSRRISQKVFAYMIMVCVMAHNAVDSIVHDNIAYVIIVLFGCCALFSIFKDEVLVLIHGLASLILILYHVAVVKSIDIADPKQLRIAVISCLGVVGITLYLAAYIRNQRKTEQRLKLLAESAQEAEHSKSDFLANMSHEIRTPMNAIVGMCELILRESDISRVVREYCFNIQNSGRSLLAIINDILDFSKIDSGKMELIEDEFNPASTLNDVINMALARMGDKNLELVVRVDPELPRGLIGDEIRIRQIIINLVTNAVKYTHSGVITLSVTQTRHDYGINLSVRVRDTGIGISPENLEKLFTSFQQVDTKKNRSVEGTGLGLAISKRLVTQMGGFISVSSEYGKGSEFRVVLPLKVKNREPFIIIKSPAPVFAAGYFNFSKFEHEGVVEEYRKLIGEIGNQLHISFTAYQSFDRLKARIARGGITHCFIGREEFLQERAYFEELAHHIEVIVIQGRLNAVTLPPQIKCVYKPFYALPIAAILNNESVIENLGEANVMTVNFTAPGARILIVDDNIINLQVAEGLMRPYHMQIITAESGRDAIRLLQSRDIDLVFMDHMMPEMDGVETTQKIRQMEGDYYKNLPIVALTANAVGGVKNMFLSSGFQAFMSKPIELSTLDKILKAWLPKHLQLKAAVSESVSAEQGKELLPERPDLLGGLIDTKLGLFYTGGDAGVYKNIFSLYIGRGMTKLERIRSLYEQKDWRNYIIDVHALKSASLTVGAKELSELAKELELAGKEGNYLLIEEKNGTLLERYQEVIEAGEAYLKEANAGAGTGADAGDGTGAGDGGESAPRETIGEPPHEIEKSRLEEIVERISRAGDSFDSDEMTAACREAFGYTFRGEALKPYFDTVISLIDDFEYEEACKAAYAVLQRLDEREG